MQVCKFQHGVGYVLFLNSSVYVIRMWRHIEMLYISCEGQSQHPVACRNEMSYVSAI
jgi:hypothetical protein